MSEVTKDDIEAYRRIHFPERVARRDAFVARGGIEIPGDGYIAELSHIGFHEWFDTRCDGTCPHLPYERARGAAPVPSARLWRPSWRQRLANWIFMRPDV